MDPVYEFIGTTNSTKFSKKIKDKEIQRNRVFVIKKNFPVLPLHNELVRESLIEHLTYVASELNTQRRAKLLAYCAYINRTYLSDSHYFSHINSEHFNGIIEEDHDCTSSSAESINSKLNSTFSNGKKSLASVLYRIHKFKKDFYNLFFQSLTPEVQALNLIPFIIDNMSL